MAVCSSTFINLGRSQAKALGLPHLPILEIPHPFGSRSRDEIKEIAENCLQQIEHFLEFGTTNAKSSPSKN